MQIGNQQSLSFNDEAIQRALQRIVKMVAFQYTAEMSNTECLLSSCVAENEFVQLQVGRQRAGSGSARCTRLAGSH
jgi:hypothetical protein